MVQSMVNEQDRIRQAFADLFRQMDKASFFLTTKLLVYAVAKLVWVKLTSFFVVFRCFQCLRIVFQDGSGTITIKEFEKGFQVETTKALFEALGLKAEDAWTLFRSLDKDLVHDHTMACVEANSRFR